MPHRSMPVIRLELETMRHSICAAFSDYVTKLDEDVQAAVEAFCTPSNLKAIIETQVRQTLTAAIQDEIKAFYSCGDGRKAVKEAIQRRLSENKTELDY
jgi:hypothetical protein